MEKITLKAQKRNIFGKQNRFLRKSGLIPAIFYGHNFPNTPLKIDKNQFEKVYQIAGQSSLVDLKIDQQEPQKTLISNVQIDPISDEPIHIDFYKVKMTEKIKTEVPVVTSGESLAVRDLDGNLILNKGSIEIECLPQDLMPEIKVDISSLKTFEDKILVKDLKIPDKITILDNLEEVAVLVTPPRTEEELEELEEKVEEKPEEIEIEKEKKPEEAEGEMAEEEAVPKPAGTSASAPQKSTKPEAPESSK